MSAFEERSHLALLAALFALNVLVFRSTLLSIVGNAPAASQVTQDARNLPAKHPAYAAKTLRRE